MLVLCIFCICCVFGFAACNFSVPNNSGKEITNEQPEDKGKEENNNQNNSEENNNEEEIIVITKDTDFDAFKSDKVEKDVFINALIFFFSNFGLHNTTNVNSTFEIAACIGDVIYGDCTLKIEGLKRHCEYREQDNFFWNKYLLFSENLEFYIEYNELKGGDIEIHDASYQSTDLNELNLLATELWESVEYNETNKQYEIETVRFRGYTLKNTIWESESVFDNVCIKIKDGYIVSFKYTSWVTVAFNTRDGFIQVHASEVGGIDYNIKCYDIGTTVVEIPDDIMAAMNVKNK